MPDQNSNHNAARPGRSRIQRLDRLASLVGGGALTVFGISRKSVTGAAIAAAGGYLIYRGFNQESIARPIHVQKTFTIMRPVQDVYDFWRDFSNLPRVMKHLQEVRTTNGRFSHWVVRAPMGMTVEWDAELTDQTPNEYLGWRTCPGSPVEHHGSVQFTPALDGEATEVSVYLQYTAPGGKLGQTFAKLFGEEPEQQVREDLRALKALLETGEVPTTEGQSSGSRSALVRMAHAAKQSMNRAQDKAVRQPAAG